MFRKKCCTENQNTYFMLRFFFFRKPCLLWDVWKNVVLYRQADHRWQYGACALRAEYLRLQTHSENV